MTRQHARICHSLGAAAVLVSAVALAGCSSDASSTSSREGPSGKSTSASDPPPPPRPQTKEECDTCGGLWAVHGIEPAESCICATSDSGQRCADGRECEGQCLVDEQAGFQVMEKSTPPLGFYQGNCSFYDTTFGCHFIIPADIVDLLPLPADEAAVKLCID